MTRRCFAGAAAGAVAASAASLPAAPRGKLIDCHSHLAYHGRGSDWAQRDRQLIDAADRLGIDELYCSILPPTRPATPEAFRQCNRWTAEAVKRYPGRIRGWAFVNPGFIPEALDDIRRCVEKDDFVGVKLYNDYVVSEPVVRPVIELAIELRIPILHHAGHPGWLDHSQPRISDGGHFAEVARHYPEAMIICAHICGGGDWEWEIKALRNARSIFLDTSGSVTDEGVVEMAVKILGAERLLFACDMSMTASVGRIRSAELTAEQREQIMSGNILRILARRKS